MRVCASLEDLPITVVGCAGARLAAISRTNEIFPDIKNRLRFLLMATPPRYAQQRYQSAATCRGVPPRAQPARPCHDPAHRGFLPAVC